MEEGRQKRWWDEQAAYIAHEGVNLDVAAAGATAGSQIQLKAAGLWPHLPVGTCTKINYNTKWKDTICAWTLKMSLLDRVKV